MTTAPTDASSNDVPFHSPIDFPGAKSPDRTWIVDSSGVSIRAYEWGSAGGRPLLLSHGGFDFARTMDVFAPILAVEGWRVVAWDHRGHGNSEHAALYSWDADIRDGIAVLDSVTNEAVPVIGHSKGGALALNLATIRPDRVSALVNLDGMPSHRTVPDISDRERKRIMAGELSTRLDFRRRAHESMRKPGTLEELAVRRKKMNPRLSDEWLRYLVTVGASESVDGWRWKLDPSMRFGGFGPFRPEWSLARMPGIAAPMLALLGLEQEDMGWGTLPEDVEPWLPPGARLVQLSGVGHFVHIEQPDVVANLVLEFLS